MISSLRLVVDWHRHVSGHEQVGAAEQLAGLRLPGGVVEFGDDFLAAEAFGGDGGGLLLFGRSLAPAA
jgi:hypothetical protein